MMAQPAPDLAEFANVEQDIELAWRHGVLSGLKLDDHQLEVYDQIAEFDARRQTAEYERLVEQLDDTFEDVFVHEAGRRVGKTHEHLVIKIEQAIRLPQVHRECRQGAMLTYATAFQKDIGEIIVPLADIICEDAPDDVRPKYMGSHREGHEGLYFPNGSVIKLVGVDKHPDALRGRFSDGVTFSEAGFIKGLEYLLRSVVLQQFQRRWWAFCTLESSTPKRIDHDFAEKLVPDAKRRGAYRMQTIDDNKAISEREYKKAIRLAGGRGNPNCERELFCVQKRDLERSIVGEFDRERHVVKRWVEPEPTHARCYVAIDPGSRDLYALVWAYWDYRRQKLVVQRSWAKRNPPTSEVAEQIKVTERNLWGGDIDKGIRPLQYAEGQRLRDNPCMRVSDITVSLIVDMQREHGLAVQHTAKDDADAQLVALRDAFKYGKVEIWEDSGPLADHLEAGVWNENRTDWDRSEVNGHYDCIAALMYMWRNVLRNRDPFPAHIPHPGEMTFTREDTRRMREPAHLRGLNDMMGRGGGGRLRLKGRGR